MQVSLEANSRGVEGDFGVTYRAEKQGLSKRRIDALEGCYIKRIFEMINVS